MKKALSLLLAAIVAVSLLAACSPAANDPAGPSQTTGSADTTSSGSEPATTPAAPTKDTVTIISSARAETLSPFSDLGRCPLASSSMYTTLLAFDAQGNVVPNLGERWEEDAEGVTVYLRQDVIFHNGDKMTADDVIFTYDHYLTMPMQSAILFQNLSTYEKIDDYTVRFYKADPYSNLLVQLAMSGTVLPKAYYEEVGAEGFEKAPIGTGPYRFVSKDVGDVVRLEAFEGFFGEQPGFKNAVIRPAQDPATAIIALEAGEVDFVVNVPAPQAALAKNNGGLRVIESLGYSNQSLVYYGEPFISDLNLRKAMFHAVNPENSIILAAEGAALPCTDMFAAASMGDLAGTLENYVGYDEALAKEYLAKSDYNGEEFLISIFANPAFAEAIQSDLKRVGINTAIEQLDLNGWMAKLINGELQLVASSSGGLIYSVETLMMTFTHAVDPTNDAAYAFDQEFEDLMAQVKAATDPAERREFVRQAHQRMYETAMFVPIYDPLFYCAHSADVSYEYTISPGINIYYVYQMKPA